MKLDPIWQADIQQTHFRLLLDAMAHPGQRKPLKARPESGSVSLVVLATLLDAEVSLADPHNLLRCEDWNKLQVQSAPVESADYILCDGSQFPEFCPKIGTLPSPEKSATVILMVDHIGYGFTRLKLSGPGIAETVDLDIEGVLPEWFARREDWTCSFPLGVDFIMIDTTQLVALPRTTKVEIM